MWIGKKSVYLACKKNKGGTTSMHLKKTKRKMQFVRECQGRSAQESNAI